MLNVQQFKTLVIEPTLKTIGLHSKSAVNLLIGTALTESGLHFIKQVGRGPALGVYQIEPVTHRSIWVDSLGNHPDMQRFLSELTGSILWSEHNADYLNRQLVVDLAYATAIARLVYWRRPEPLPALDDHEGLARYWKDFYNTRLGAGKPEDFLRAIEPHKEILCT